MQSDIDWQPQHDLLDEAQIVLEFIDQVHHHLPTPGPIPVPHEPVPPTPGVAMLPATTAVSSISDPDPPAPQEGDIDTFEDAKQLMQEVLASKGLRTINDIENTTTLYLMDTGGQPEFHEIMPLILNGPALHLVFFNLAIDLNDPVVIRFCKQDGEDAMITYMSSYTGKQMIYQLLSSLYCLGKDLFQSSAAVLIGTHLDQLINQEGQTQKELQEINDSLKQLLSNTEFHDRGFLTYPKKDENSTIFIPVNNYSGGEEEIQQLQAFLTQIIDDRFCPVELPSSWLLFHLILRHRYENSSGVCKLEECRALAKGCGLDEGDVPQVLRYIHRHLGTILFYEDVQGLNEVVICDPNVLFNSIYNIIAVSFAGHRSYHSTAAETRKTGEIPCEVLARVTTEPSRSLLTNEHVIELLKHFKILTELLSDDRIIYFMPCLLVPDHSLDLSCEAVQALCPPPLLVLFDGNYIPVGMFSTLVVKLSQCSWEPDRDLRYRNHILFHTDNIFPVELIVHPAYLEFRIRVANYEKEKPDIHQFCMEVRQTVVNTLKAVLGLHEHTRKVGFQLGFYCQGSFTADQPHFSGCLPRRNYTNPKAVLCSKSPRCQGQCRLPHECTVWFDYRKVS